MRQVRQEPHHILIIFLEMSGNHIASVAEHSIRILLIYARIHIGKNDR